MRPYIDATRILEDFRNNDLEFEKIFKKHYPFPHVLNIETTNKCNLRCIMCDRDQGREEGYMEAAVFRKLIQECSKYMPRIWLNLAGEPLLHPMLIDFIEFAKESGIQELCLNTNATLLNGTLRAEIIDSGLDLLAVSIDSLREEVFKNIRIGADLNKVLDNVMGFLDARKARAAERPKLDIAFLTMAENLNEIEEFKFFWMERLEQGDSVSFSRWNSRVKQPASLNNDLEAADRLPCIQLWRNSAVTWNGDVLVCYGDFRGKTKVGNVNNSSLYELWHGDSLMNIRKKHVLREFTQSDTCSDCSEWHTESQKRYRRFYR